MRACCWLRVPQTHLKVRFGIQLWFLIAGFSCVLVGLAGFFLPEVMGIEKR